ncbi:hypothetical protein TPELB_21340 [Terrisporobacter petrolearius]|uniref:Uncharacterized protein n=1 Tax=Terrisporobacter petrolearius TaxID=1460447 RepID=A0ABZ3FF40_9FIRM
MSIDFSKCKAIKIEKYLRAEIKKDKWFNKSDMCYITGGTDNLVVHHLGKSFKDMFDETLKKLNIIYKPYKENYSHIELIQIKEELINQHKHYSEPITLNETVHTDMHLYFASKNVSREELEEFKNVYHGKRIYKYEKNNGKIKEIA